MRKPETFFLISYFEIQSSFKIIRTAIIQYGFQVVKALYQPLKKGAPWKLSAKELLHYPDETLGKHVAAFLYQNNFDFQPKSEEHDFYHVIAGYGTDTCEELEMQFWLWGNGKRSIPTILCIVAGILVFPDHIKEFRKARLLGSYAAPIHQINFLEKIHCPLGDIRRDYSIILKSSKINTYEN